MTIQYRQLEQRCKEELPFYSLRPSDVGPKNSFLRVVDNFSISMKSPKLGYKDMKPEDFQDFVLKHYEKRGFTKIKSDVGDNRLNMGGTDIIVNMCPNEHSAKVTVFEYNDKKLIPTIEKPEHQNEFKM